ncbi:MAG: hypothetical protein IT158_21125 [Bryobacterales bacterium]|nr:hypothetical protein [Bryobacterales bacterium]
MSGAFAAQVPKCWLQDGVLTPGRSAWLTCDGGRLLVSRDEGATWQERALNPEWKFRSIGFIDDRRGLLAGDEGLLLATSDGGETWTRIESGTTQHLTDIAIAGERVWVASYGGGMLHSGDAGKTWQQQRTFTGASLESVQFLDERSGWAVGWSGTVLRTTDGGANWRAVPVPGVNETLTSVFFKDERGGWITGMLGTLLRTGDGGKTWHVQPLPVRDWLTSIVFDRQGRGWLAAGTELLESPDGGATWQRTGVTADVFLGRLLPGDDRVWIVGPSGVLVRYGAENGWRRLSTLDMPGQAGAGTAEPPLRQNPARPPRRN